MKGVSSIRRLARGLYRFTLPFLVAALGVSPDPLAPQRTLVLERFDVELRVDPSGVFTVTETLRPRFSGAWQGLFRDLSLEHRTAEGRRRLLEVELLAVTDEAGRSLTFEDTREGPSVRRFRIWVPGAQDATRTVVLRYRVSNGLRFFAEGSEPGPLDEIYWNVTGNRWEVPIEAASARVVLPPGAVPRQWAAYTGPEGSRGTDAQARLEGGVVEFHTTRVLGPGEGLTVAVGWEPGVVARPPSPPPWRRALFTAWPWLVPFLAFWFGHRSWSRHGRDPAPQAVVVRYEPPEGLGPTEVGTLVDHTVEMHDLTATLVDLAVRGYLTVEERQEKLLGLLPHREYWFHHQDPPPRHEALTPHEEEFLRALFAVEGPSSARAPAAAASVSLSSLKNRFYRHLPAIRKAVYRQLIAKGCYRKDPVAVRGAWSLAGILFIAVGAFAWFFSFQAYEGEETWKALGGALVLSGLVILGWGQIMPARTEQGARAREWALGFREFLRRVEEDRFRRMITSPQLFERYLPYAMAFRVEGRWARAFEGLYTEPPRWYRGDQGASFRPSAFTRDLGRMVASAATAMTSSPSSRGSSSGSGGGGSSGGGSGGGGGGGF